MELKELVNKVSTLPQLSDLVARPGKSILLSPLTGTAKTLIYSALLSKINTNSLILTAKEEEAERIFEELAYFLAPFSLPATLSLFPAPDIIPYGKIIPSTDILSTRAKILAELCNKETKIIVAPLKAVLIKTLPKAAFSAIALEVGSSKISREELLKTLVELGYQRVSMVEELGEFAARGSIVDIFSFGGENPLRVEFFGDRIESLRTFAIGSQRSILRVKTANILQSEKEVFAKPAAGSLFAYLPPQTTIIFDDQKAVADQITHLRSEAEIIKEEQGEAKGDFYLTSRALNNLIDPYPIIKSSPFPQPESREIAAKKPDNFRSNIGDLTEYLNSSSLAPVFITKNKERLNELLAKENTKPYSLLFGNISDGIIFNDLALALFSDREIFGEIHHPKIRLKAKEEAAPKLIEDFVPGEYIVHENYGIGIYRGLKILNAGGKESEYIHIKFAGTDKLYISPDQMHLIYKYSGSKDVSPPLNHLGDKNWQRTKNLTQKSILNLTKELLELYQVREAKPGFAFPPDHPWQNDFEASFPYDETPDQIAALKALKQNMEAAKPMDMLLCGDVGFGKTEVALRAAFKAAAAGKQVAILAPTTILVEQHYNNFKERLAPFPLTLEMLSRFRSRKEQAEVIKGLAHGSIDIVIGTHRLIQKDIAFRDLGLFIIDEEQRFGVAHKERLKKLKKTVDVLTMTATPIPRTLYLSLSGIRDMSMIGTPPLNRSPIRTYIVQANPLTIKEAIMRELERGGQVYFLHNIVETIEGKAKQIRKLVPQARVAVAHGQMREKELEQIMLDFIHRKIDVLVCTTIIESGIDIPSVNTIIIDHAGRFGLADLYQLRGRVGRSNVKAFAYLFYEKGEILTDDALTRLSAIADYSALGSGYKIALRDLEIRGAGNVLGAEQHGHMLAVGFDLYSAMLNQSVNMLKGIPTPEKKEVKMNLKIDAFIPKEFVSEERERIALYKRMNYAQTNEEIAELKNEIADRFGALPLPVKNLLKIMRLRFSAKKANITTIEQKGDKITLTYASGKQKLLRISAKGGCASGAKSLAELEKISVLW